MGASTADKHHASHQSHATKRKEPPADHTPPKAKKAVATDRKSKQSKPTDDAQQALRDRHRQAVSALYTAYEQLSASSEGADSDAAAFDTLLEGAKAGTCAQRVAARLIPRFAHRFPQKLEQAAAALISITGSHSSTKDPESVRALSKAARPEALHGLAKVCEAASGVASSAGGAVVTKAAEVLLRRMSSEVNGKTSTSAVGGTSEPACALQALQLAFRSSTRVVLATSLQGLKSEDGKTRDGSRYFLQQLLAPPQQITTATGATANGHASNAAVPGLCLAAEVLATQTDTQHWLRNTAKAFRAEPPKHRGKEALALLDRLLEALPLDAPSHLAVPPSSAAAAAATGTGAPLPPPPAAPALPTKPLPPPPVPAATEQAAGGAATAAPADDDDDVNMDLEEGQLADSPVAQPPLPPPEVQDAAPQQPPRPPAMPAPDPAALRPGGMLCRAAATLWLGRVPRLVGEASLQKECSKAGGAERIVLPKREEAFVTFSGMREAALAYEQLCGTAPWGGPRLDVEFCSEDSPPAAPSGARRPVAVWVGGPCNPAGEAEVIATLKAAGIPPASGVLRVGGARPGLMLQFPDELVGDAALAALRAGKDGSRSAAGRNDACTVVVSQVSPVVHERELLGAFARIAEPVRWQTSRGGAVITFRSPSAAAAAVQALDGVPLGPSRIRVALHAPPDAAKSATASASEPKHAQSAASTPSPGPSNLPTAAAANEPPGFCGGGGGSSSVSRRRRRGWDDGPPGGQSAAGAPRLPAAPSQPGPSPSVPPKPSPAPSPATGSVPSPAVASLQAETATLQARATQNPAAAATAPLWKGRLGRPSVQPCKVVCLDRPPAGAQPGGLAASEPNGWPPLLEVRSRIATTLLTGQKLAALARQDIAVRRLAPEGSSERHAFIRFMQYLSDKQRSGVVELGPAGNGGPPRTLYIVPPSRTVCDELRIAWEPEEILMAVMVPAVAKDGATAT